MPTVRFLAFTAIDAETVWLGWSIAPHLDHSSSLSSERAVPGAGGGMVDAGKWTVTSWGHSKAKYYCSIAVSSNKII